MGLPNYLKNSKIVFPNPQLPPAPPPGPALKEGPTV